MQNILPTSSVVSTSVSVHRITQLDFRSHPTGSSTPEATTMTFLCSRYDKPVYTTTSIRPINPSNILWLWLDLSFLTCGIPILPFQADFTIFSDAPTQRWGPHMGDSQISGTWTHSDRKLHINCLELEVVILALRHWVTVCQGQQVMIAADNFPFPVTCISGSFSVASI